MRSVVTQLEAVQSVCSLQARLAYQRTYGRDDQELCIPGRSVGHTVHSKTWTSHPRAVHRRKDGAASAYRPAACQAIGCGGPWWLVFVGEPKRSSSTETLRTPDIATSPLLRPRSLCNEEYTLCLIWRTNDPERLSGGSCSEERGLPPTELESAFDRGDKQWSWFPRRSHRNSRGTCGKTSEDISRSLGCWRCSCRLGILVIEVNIFHLSLLPLFVRVNGRTQALLPDWIE